MTPDELGAGAVLGDYEIISVAGSGGMGVVYRAEQRSLNRIVALKVIGHDIANSGDYRERFLREARLAASVDHPHVVSVYDVGEQNDRLFLAMQWIDGEDLRNLIDREGALTPERAVSIAEQLAGALDAVHDAGLIHRDVKPANVLLRHVGERDHAYLTDFGVAKAPKMAMDTLTRTGWVVGTAGYLAPEQIMGQGADSRSDLYAMACLTFELMTGKAPFSGANEMALRWAHANNPRPQASLSRPALGTKYDGFLMQALSVEPRDRFQSGKAFAAALRSAHTSLEAPRQAPAAAAPQPAQTLPTQTLPVQTLVQSPAPATTPARPPTPVRPASTPVAYANLAPAHGYPVPPPSVIPRKPSSKRPALVGLAVAAVAGIAVGALAAGGVLSKGTPKQRPGGTAANGAGSFLGQAAAASAAKPANSSTTAQVVEPADPSSARAAIMGVLTSYAADYSSSNLSGLSDLFTPEVERHGLGPNGCATVRGKSNVLAQYQGQFAHGSLDYQLIGLSPSDISFSAQDAASVHTTYLIASSKNTGPVSFWFTNQANTWLIDTINATCHPTS